MTKLEVRKMIFRMYREKRFKAFDLWEKAIVRGRETDNTNVMAWYQAMKDFPTLITENTTVENYPITPEVIKKYL